jgi:hypothetical protein
VVEKIQQEKHGNFMKKLILMVALAFVSTAATSDWAVKGEGNYSCPEYVAARRSNDAKLFSSISWVQGFITAVNYQRAIVTDIDSFIGQDLPAASIVRWLENYCQENLVDDVADAAKALVEELITKE